MMYPEDNEKKSSDKEYMYICAFRGQNRPKAGYNRVEYGQYAVIWCGEVMFEPLYSTMEQIYDGMNAAGGQMGWSAKAGANHLKVRVITLMFLDMRLKIDVYL